MILYVYKKKDKGGVYARSPYLIITCGIGLMMDSIYNIIINLIPQWNYICFLGIYDTVVNHYIAWGSIVLR